MGLFRSGNKEEIDKSASEYLKTMRETSGVDKGVWGERAILRLLLDIYRERGGILIHSYEYKVDSDKNGNIKFEDGKHYLENLGSTTEIDILYVSQYRVFPIEVKSYAADKITLTTGNIEGCHTVNKSPIHQNEMHCNHLYTWIAEAINGNPDFIVPIVAFNVFKNKPIIEDKRPDNERSYILVANTGNIKETILKYDTPLDYRINLDQMDRMLKNAMVSSEAYYNVQWR